MKVQVSPTAAELEADARSALAGLDGRPPRLRWVELTASTNTDLLAAGTPPPEGLALIAEQQSAGRGRLGRHWRSQAGGSLCLSLALPWPGGIATAAGAGLVAGLAVAQALHAFGADEVRLKWPNDLWARDRKLGGVLVEIGGRAERMFLVVGVGLNLRLPADFATDLSRIDLSELGVNPDRVDLAARLLLALRQHLWRLQREALGALLPAWQRFDCLQGRAVRMLAGDEVCEGEVLGVAPDGGLRVRHAGGERVWHSGEASPRLA